MSGVTASLFITLLRAAVGIDEAQLIKFDIRIADIIWQKKYGAGKTCSYCLGVEEALGDPTAKELCNELAVLLGDGHCALAVANEGGMPATVAVVEVKVNDM